MTRRRRLVLVAVLGCAIAGFLHYRAHYAARERPGRPGPEAAALLEDPSWRAVVWIPFPHQNLEKLEERIGDLRVRARELAEADDPESARSIPRFGPFVTPPARELVVALGESGGTRALVRAYPLVAALARAAGLVAGNPWLAGGEIRAADGSPRGEVEWQGTLWSYSRKGSAPALGSAPRPSASNEPRSSLERLPVKGKRGRARRQPHSGGGDAAARGPSDALESSGFSPSVGAFALLALSGGWSPLPPGLYRFVRVPSSGRLEVVAGSPPAGSLLPEALVPPAAEAPAGWYLERRGAAGDEPGEALRAIALWSDPGEVAGLPRIAALDRGGIRRYSLPGEGIVRLVGGRAFESSAAGIRVRALDAEAAGRGERFALALAVDSPDARASVLAAARPDELEPVVRGIAEKLSLLPGLAEPERRAFARAAVVLRTLRGCSASTLEVGARNSFVRLIPCSQGVLDRGQSR